MPIDAESLPNAESTVAVPGVLCVTPLTSGGNLVHLGPAAGWMVPRGLLRWERELSFMARADMTSQLGQTLRATLPHEQIPPKKLPLSYRAVEASPFLALTPKVASEARKQGLRVHTVGVDRVSAGFFYLAEGGGGPPVHAEGNLVEMLAPSLKASATNAEIAALQDGLVDRLLAHYSDGVLSELAVELADALPRLSNDGTGLAGTQLEVFELQVRALSGRSQKWEASARDIAEALQAAAAKSERTARVPLYGEARQQMMRQLKVQIGDDTVTLPARYRWTVMGQPREELKSAERPQPAPAVQIPQPTPSPPRTGPAVPRPEPAAVRRSPKPGAAEVAAVPKSPPPAEAKPAPAEVQPHPAAAAKDVPQPEARRPAEEAAADGARHEANGKVQATPEPKKAEEAAKRTDAVSAPSTAKDESKRTAKDESAPASVRAKGKPSKDKRSKSERPSDERRRDTGSKRPAKSTTARKDGAPSKAPAKATPPARTRPRAVVVLLLLATAVVVYLRWHDTIARFVSQFMHGE